MGSFDVTKAFFVERLLKLTAKYDTTSELYWNDTDKGLKFYIICNDFFGWACADGEDIENEEDLTLLEQSLKDSEYYGQLLYCARRRKMRPQGAYYSWIDEKEWHLFDGCGEEREIDACNPYKPGEYKTERMKKKENANN